MAVYGSEGLILGYIGLVEGYIGRSTAQNGLYSCCLERSTGVKGPIMGYIPALDSGLQAPLLITCSSRVKIIDQTL